MADQTFTSGQILTAAQMTTLQDNSGLVVVTPTGATGGTISGSTVTIGAGVSSVAVAGAFSSSFDSYKIIISGGVASASAGLTLILTGSVTGYYAGEVRVRYDTGAVSGTGYNNSASWEIARVFTDTLACSWELIGPFLAKPTVMTSSGNDTRVTAGTSARQQTGVHSVASSFSGFTIAPDAGTLTGGSIRVYGYRNS